MLSYSGSKAVRKMMKFAKCYVQFVKRDCEAFCEPSPLVSSGHLEALVRDGWQSQKLLKAKQVNALG